MHYLIKSSSIQELKLSTRTYNALMRANKTTVGDLVELSMEDIYSIKNMGKKSIDELNNVIKNITLVDELPDEDSCYNEEIKTFIGNDGIVYKDVIISELQLSNRASNCLKNNNMFYISQLLSKSEEELFKIKNMGAKSVHEIIGKIKTLKLTPIDLKNICEPYEEKICRVLLKEIVNKFQVPATSLYEKILFLIENIIQKHNLENEDIYDNLIPSLYEVDEIKEALIVFVIKKIEENENGILELKLYDQLPNCLKNQESFHLFMLHILQQKLIFINEDELYEKRYPTIIEYANSISDDRASHILRMRLNGMTLEEVGNKFEVTRERIRQIEAKYIKKSPRLREDKYVYVFEQYDISREDFLLGFREKIETYNYLSIAYNHGNKNVNDMLDDPNISNKERICVERIIYKNYVMLNGERVLRSRPDLSEYVLRTVGSEGITFDEFKELYQMLLEDLDLQDNPKFTLMERGYENKMAASNHVLWKRHKKMRYYNLDAYDYSDLFTTLDLSQYTNIEISTLKLFNENPDLMQEYDIQDEYELHNLLKKICPDEVNIKFNRMPNIEFGKANRDKQVMDLLVELAPVTNVDLADAYEKEYGVLSRTVLANYMKSFNKYFFDGVYKIDAPHMSEVMVNELIKQLDQEFYLLTEIRRIYEKTFPKADPHMLNPFTIKELGFRVYTNYVVSNKYLSAVDYFRTILTKDDLVDTSVFPDGLQTLLAYMAEVYRLKSCYEIVEYKPQKFINIRRLDSVGSGVDSIKDYCKRVYSYATPTYFTAYSLRKNGFDHKLDELGFDEWFYSSLLVEDKEHFTYRRLGRNRLFRKGKGEVLLVDFLEWILYSTESLSMDVYDLSDYLSNEYNISVNTFKLIETVSGSTLYYDKITEKIYADYEVYFAEI